ncbi:MAG: TldD/PmbA family protein, partial [Cyanobacteria bacterium REEB65]|nr:TldD/PmbA family protein [Cyanobacteria bacterium REEB65]
MRELLERLAAKVDGFVELRYHRQETRAFDVEKGRVENTAIARRGGVGVRVLEEGTWGFAATSDPSEAAIAQAIDEATAAARATSRFRKTKLAALPPGALAKGNFAEGGYEELYRQPIEAKIQLALDAERAARAVSPHVETARSSYRELFEEKTIVTSDGASCEVKLVRPEFRVNAVASLAGDRATFSESVGATGGWDCVFREASSQELAERASRKAVDLTSAPYAPGGRFKVVLAPSIVGLLVHEAIGHTVEA